MSSSHPTTNPGALPQAGRAAKLTVPVQIKAAENGGTPEDNCFPARIVTVTYLGEDLRLDLELPAGQMLQGTLKNTGAARDWVPAQTVKILVDPADLRLLRR